jgi:hypothetical protein
VRPTGARIRPDPNRGLSAAIKYALLNVLFSKGIKRDGDRLANRKEPFVMPFRVDVDGIEPISVRRVLSSERGFPVLAPIPRGSPRLRSAPWAWLRSPTIIRTSALSTFAIGKIVLKEVGGLAVRDGARRFTLEPCAQTRPSCSSQSSVRFRVVNSFPPLGKINFQFVGLRLRN